jgi:multidrug efflux pump subunit AcrA (membrane-fusion protein)
MKRAFIWIIVIVVVIAGVFFVRMSQIRRGQQEREEMVNSASKEVVVPVIVAPVIEGDVERIHRYTGTVEAEERVQVFPKVSGRIISVKVDEGDVVADGDVIAVIDPEITGQRFEPFEVTSPIRGKISQVFFDAGTLVNQAQPIVEVIDDSAVKVEIGVLEKDYHMIKEGTPVRIEFDALPGRVVGAKVTNRSPVVNARTGSAKTEIRLDNRDGMLKTGMFARVQMIIEVHVDAVLMPLAATLTEVLPGRGNRAETTVFVINGNIAEARDVVLGLAGPTHYEVLEGLRPGEEVVVTGQNLLSDGTRVRLQDLAQ